MSVAIVFTLVFLSLLGITLGFPSVPPAGMLRAWLRIPEITLNFPYVSGEVLVNGIINGAVWGSFIAVIYRLGRGAPQKVVVMPVSEPPPPPPTPAPAPVVRRPPVKPQPYLSKVTTFVPLNKDVKSIGGIGLTYGSRLRLYGIRDVEDLLRSGATWKGRRDLADKLGVSTKQVFKWVNQADFSRIRGVGTHYAELLDSAGLNTVTDLAWRNPKTLYVQIKETNQKKSVVRRSPPYTLIYDWVKDAKSLERIVETDVWYPTS